MLEDDLHLVVVTSHVTLKPHLVVICFIRCYQQRLCTRRCPSLVAELCHIINRLPCHATNSKAILLYRRWVQHNSNRCAEGLGRKVASELCSYYTGVAWRRCQFQSRSSSLSVLPNVPCGLVTVPQMTLIFEPRTSLCAR